MNTPTDPTPLPGRMAFWFRHRLAHRFAFWSATITLLVTVTLGVLSFQVTTVLVERHLQRALEYHLNFYAENLTDHLSETLLFTEDLADNTLSSQGLADSEGRQAYLLPFLRETRIPYSIPFNIHLCDFKGRPLVSKEPGMLPDIPYLQWADEVVEHGRPMAGISRREGWLALAYPVIYRATGLPEGMLVVEFDFKDVNRKAAHILEAGSRSHYWFSSLGTSPPAIRDYRAEEGLLLQQVLNLPSPLDRLGLNIAVGQDVSFLKERLDLLLLHYLLILVGTVFLTVGLTLTLVRRLTRPLLELTRVAGEIADQGTPDRFARVEGVDELGDLARSFNRMVERLHTSQSDLEQRVEERTRDLSRMQQEAEAASRAKSEFLSIVTHEIRTPLNVIIGLGDQLAEAPLAEEQRHHVEVMRRAGEVLLTLVNDVLELARVESGTLTLSHVPFDLEEVVQGTAELMAVRAREKKIQLLTWIHAATPLRLRGDDKRLRQVLINLLGNSLKFTELGEIVLQVHPLPPEENGSLRLLFSIKDTGIGIPADKIRMIFEPFTQVDTSNSRRFQGSGLGLAIAKRFVEQMGGTLRVESTLGAGSLFQFDLPVQLQESPFSTEVPLPGLKVELRVDAPVLQASLLDLLPGLGVEVCSDPGPAAPCCDVVITDRRLPRAPDSPPALRLLPTYGATEGGAPHEGGLAAPWSRSMLLRAIRDLLGAVPATSVAMGLARRAVPCFDGARILLVEDAEDNILLMEMFLRGTGCVLRKARNGLEAVEAFRRERFDLILMDIQMPVMDGLEATRRIRAMEQEAGRGITPIVALTAFAWAEEGGACLVAGCTGHLAKPVRKAQIFEMLRSHLQETDSPG